eukprot:Rmarinus@m.10900
MEPEELYKLLKGLADKNELDGIEPFITELKARYRDVVEVVRQSERPINDEDFLRDVTGEYVPQKNPWKEKQWIKGRELEYALIEMLKSSTLQNLQNELEYKNRLDRPVSYYDSENETEFDVAQYEADDLKEWISEETKILDGLVQELFLKKGMDVTLKDF